MKHVIDLPSEPLTEYERLFLMYWKQRKGYLDHKTLTLTECIEFLQGYSFTYHREISLFDEMANGTYFNNVLIVGELVMAWDGEAGNLIDTAFYYVLQTIKKRLATSHQFPQTDLV